MTGRSALAAAVALAGLGGGCGTVDNIRRPVLPPPNNPNAQVCRVYGGVRGDWAVMAEYPWGNAPTFLDYIVVPAMAVADLALTGVGDTVTLPYTAAAEARRALDHSAASSPLPLPVTVSDPNPDPAP